MEKVIIELSGRIDSSNAGSIEKDVMDKVSIILQTFIKSEE